MKTLIRVAALITVLTAGNAYAECTLNPDVTFPKTLTLKPSASLYAYYQPMLSVIHPASVVLSTVASSFGITRDTTLVTCTDGEDILVENTESTINNTGFSTTVDGVTYYTGIGSVDSGSDFSRLQIPTSSGVRQVSISSDSGIHTLKTIMKYDNFGIKLSVRRPAYYVSGEVEPLFLFRIVTTDNQEIARFYLDSFYLQNGTCRSNSFDGEVSFNNLIMQSLKETGSTSDTANFNINVSCGSAGLTPAITFTGDTDSEYTNVFTNPSGDGYAQGVGIQILKESVITPGEEISLGTTSTTDAVDYEFSSRLFSLAQTTTVGTIDIPVIFTLTYE